MIFTKDSGLVQIWANMVLTGAYKLEQVPKLFNLQEMVNLVVEENKTNV